MDSHLCLNLEALAHNGEGLYELIRECPEACHNILNIAAEQLINAAAYDTVAEIMERTLVLGKISRTQSVTNHHIGVVIEHLVHHLAGKLHRIGIIAVHHNVALGVNLPEHSPDNITLALHIFMLDYGAGFFSYLHGSVGRIVIIYIYRRLRQCCFSVPNNLTDSFLLVVTRYQYSDLIHIHIPSN